MSEFQIIQNTLNPQTKQSLCHDFKKLGLKNGDIVLVHASLSKLGWVIGKEITVIEALKEVVGEEGTIIMPSFSSDNSDPTYWQNPPVPDHWISIIKENMPAFHPLKTPTREMGRIAEAFWHYPNTKRSNHPTCSFSAHGKYSSYLTKEHPLTPAFGYSSPLYKLYEMNTKVLLLGVDYDHCTCLHLGEVKLTAHHNYHNQGSCIIKGDKALWVNYKDINYDDSDFLELGYDFESKYPIQIGYVGQAKSKLIEMKVLCDFAEEWLKQKRTF